MTELEKALYELHEAPSPLSLSKHCRLVIVESCCRAHAVWGIESPGWLQSQVHLSLWGLGYLTSERWSLDLGCPLFLPEVCVYTCHLPSGPTLLPPPLPVPELLAALCALSV